MNLDINFCAEELKQYSSLENFNESLTAEATAAKKLAAAKWTTCFQSHVPMRRRLAQTCETKAAVSLEAETRSKVPRCIINTSVIMAITAADSVAHLSWR